MSDSNNNNVSFADKVQKRLLSSFSSGAPNAKPLLEIVKSRAVFKCMEKILTEVIFKEMLEDPAAYMDEPEFIEFTEKYLELQDSKLKAKELKYDYPFDTHPYLLLTVNLPADDNTQEDFLKLFNSVEKCMSKKWINKSVWSFEKYTEKGEHLHCHMFINRENKPTCHIYREMKSTFNKVVDVDNPHYLNFRFIKTTDYTKTLNYIIGSKKDLGKQELQAKDIVFRTQMEIEPFYLKGDIEIEESDEDEEGSKVEEVEEDS